MSHDRSAQIPLSWEPCGSTRDAAASRSRHPNLAISSTSCSSRRGVVPGCERNSARSTRVRRTATCDRTRASRRSATSWPPSDSSDKREGMCAGIAVRVTQWPGQRVTRGPSDLATRTCPRAGPSDGTAGRTLPQSHLGILQIAKRRGRRGHVEERWARGAPRPRALLSSRGSGPVGRLAMSRLRRLHWALGGPAARRRSEPCRGHRVGPDLRGRMRKVGRSEIPSVDAYFLIELARARSQL